MDTGAPATERGQQRRISLMILLMIILVGTVLTYGMLDKGRATDAAEAQKEEAANHGASLFARNCAGCHGTHGQGLIGPALNTVANRPDDTATVDQLKDLYHNTITCGRVGTAMPAWGQTQKGPLNDFQIGQLVALITTQGAGGAADESYWDHAEELWHELNPSLSEPVIAGAPSINQQACGQYAPGAKPTATATASPTTTAEPTGTPTEAPTSTTGGDPELGRQYFLGGPCIACHTIDGTVAAGTVGPNLTHFASNGPFAGDTLELTAENVTAWLKDPPSQKPGTSMPNLGLADADIANLVAFLLTLQ